MSDTGSFAHERLSARVVVGPYLFTSSLLVRDTHADDLKTANLRGNLQPPKSDYSSRGLSSQT
jgi:hypothetical protein